MLVTQNGRLMSNLNDCMSQNALDKANVFYCDDIIAPLVALLNKKGYTTRNSCAGHMETAYACIIDEDEIYVNEDYSEFSVPYIQFDTSVTRYLPITANKYWMFEASSYDEEGYALSGIPIKPPITREKLKPLGDLNNIGISMYLSDSLSEKFSNMAYNTENIYKFYSVMIKACNSMIKEVRHWPDINRIKNNSVDY